jgi:hypothetical protein
MWLELDDFAFLYIKSNRHCFNKTNIVSFDAGWFFQLVPVLLRLNIKQTNNSHKTKAFDTNS